MSVEEERKEELAEEKRECECECKWMVMGDSDDGGVSTCWWGWGGSCHSSWHRSCAGAIRSTDEQEIPKLTPISYCFPGVADSACANRKIGLGTDKDGEENIPLACSTEVQRRDTAL